MSVPILNLRSLRDGAEAQVACCDMSLAERLAVLQAALTTLFTGRFEMIMPHVRARYQGQDPLADVPTDAPDGGSVELV
ncbi:MAG: hypothetical protein ACREU7_15015 [Burkholderiales bacterium]